MPQDTIAPASFPTEFDAENAVLFLGAGFSAGAPNVERQTLPLGNPLKQRLSDLLGVDPGDYDLQTLSQEFAGGDGDALYQLLYNIFTVTSLLPDQYSILSHRWRRIYTTNYDDCVEFANRKLQSFSFDDPKPRNLPKNFVAHLHGTIRKASPANILSQLVLNEASYVRQIAEPSAWLDEFARDLRFSSSCFFVGYSLADHHITAVMQQSEEAKNRTYFITGQQPGPIFTNRVKNYGAVLPVGRDGLAAALLKTPAPSLVSDIKLLKSFKYIDPYADKKSTTETTPIEVLNLITFGKFVLNRFISSYSSQSYVICRSEHIKEALTSLTSARSILVHSRLGNGKTIFSYILSLSMSEKGFKCFHWRQQVANFQAEVDLLAKSGRVLIVIDDYDAAIENIQYLATALPEAKFLVTARSSQQAVRFHEVRESFPSPFRVLAIDRLSSGDKTDLLNLLNISGMSAPGLRKAVRDASELRDIILAFYRNKDVSRRVGLALAPLLLANGSKFVMIAAHLGRWAGVEISSQFISRAGRIDAYTEIMRHADLARDLFNLDEGAIGTRSSLLAQYLIEEQFSAADLCDVCHDLIVAAVDRKTERRYRKLMAGLMQIGDLKKVMSAKQDSEECITKMFERLARDLGVNKEPLFWLQYAILMINGQNYEAAESFLATSYDRAATSYGFETYQLDTQSLRIALIVETASNLSTVERFAQIIKGFEDVLPMITDESHRFFAIRILELVEPFCASRGFALSKNEKILIVFEIRRLIQALSSFDSYLRAQTGSDIVRAKLEAAILLLAA